MTSDVENPTPTSSTTTEHTAELNVSPEAPGALSTLSAEDNPVANLDVREKLDKAARFLVEFPEFLTQAVAEYQKPLTTVALIIALLITVAIADGVLDVLNAIPLMAPLLELIGLGYSGWFVWRYLRFAETRKELGQNYQTLKQRITGEK